MAKLSHLATPSIFAENQIRNDFHRLSVKSYVLASRVAQNGILLYEIFTFT